MRKTLVVAVLTTALTTGPAALALAEANTLPQVLAQGTEEDATEESDKTGLWGLLGLAGLAGLAKRKEHNEDVAGRRR